MNQIRFFKKLVFQNRKWKKKVNAWEIWWGSTAKVSWAVMGCRAQFMKSSGPWEDNPAGRSKRERAIGIGAKDKREPL